MSEDLVSVAEIAKEHSRHRSVLHKIIKRLGMETQRARSDDARGQEVVYISRSDYALLKPYLESRQDEIAESVTDEWRGFLYIAQLEPQLDPGRFKIGFASTVSDRLKAHRTSAPFATVLRDWPCKLLWEKTAIECITADCEKLHTEVFRSAEIEAVIERANKFFAIMPRLGN